MKHSKPLRDLDPRWTDGGTGDAALVFQCPACESGHYHRIPVEKPNQMGAKWTRNGEDLERLTLTPSINATKSGDCKFHGFITDGVVIW